MFLGVGVTTSLFIFEAGKPQNGQEIFACYMKDDGLVTVKNKGRHDVYGKWSGIEEHWLDILRKQSGDDTCQWIKPEEHLSYQMSQKPFEIFAEDFKKTALDYLMFEQGVDSKEFNEKLLEKVLYGSDVDEDSNDYIEIKLGKAGENGGKD